MSVDEITQILRHSRIEELAQTLLWIGGILIVILLLRTQIKSLFDIFRDSRARTVKIGGAEVTLSDIDKGLVDREILRVQIIVACADGHIDDQEKDKLSKDCFTFTTNPEILSDQDRQKIIREGIAMALVDRNLDPKEYETLQRLADQIGFDKGVLKTLCLQGCEDLGIDLSCRGPLRQA